MDRAGVIVPARIKPEVARAVNPESFPACGGLTLAGRTPARLE
jgi:hypothetical protein